jgi:hypothetical protein
MRIALTTQGSQTGAEKGLPPSCREVHGQLKRTASQSVTYDELLGKLRLKGASPQKKGAVTRAVTRLVNAGVAVAWACDFNDLAGLKKDLLQQLQQDGDCRTAADMCNELGLSSTSVDIVDRALGDLTGKSLGTGCVLKCRKADRSAGYRARKSGE